MASGIRRMLDSHRKKSERHSVVYTGSWHDSIPRRLILAPDLTPSEKIVWQVIRTHVSQPGEDGAWPSISRIARLAGISRPTAQNAIDVLQALRWMIVSRKVRDERGVVIGNFYLVHPQPLSPADTMLLDPSYLEALKRMAKSEGPSKKRVRLIARRVLDELGIRKEETPSSLSQIADNLRENMREPSTAVAEMIQDAIKNQKVGDRSPSLQVVQTEQQPAEGGEHQDLPECLRSCKPKALSILEAAPPELRGAILEAVAKAKDLRSPLAYLSRLVDLARKGRFVDTGKQEREQRVRESVARRQLALIQNALSAGRTVKVKGIDVSETQGFLILFADGTSCNIVAANVTDDDIHIEPPP